MDRDKWCWRQSGPLGSSQWATRDKKGTLPYVWVSDADPALRFTGDGRWLIAQSGASLHTLWNLADPQSPPKIIKGFAGHYFGATKKKDYLVLHNISQGGSKGKLVDLSHAEPFAQPTELDGVPPSQFNSFSKDGKWLALVTGSGTGVMYDLAPGMPSQSLEPIKLTGPKKTGAKQKYNVLATNGEFSDDGKQLFAYLGNGTLRTWKRQDMGWDLEAQDDPLPTLDVAQSVTVKADFRGLRALAFYPPDKSADRNKQFPGYLFDAGALDVKVDLDVDLVESLKDQKHVHVDVGKNWLAARYQIRLGNEVRVEGIRLWGLKTRNVNVIKPIFLEVKGGANDFTLTADGRWLIVKSLDNTVRLWDLQSLGARESRTHYLTRSRRRSIYVFSKRISIWHAKPLACHRGARWRYSTLGFGPAQYQC